MNWEHFRAFCWLRWRLFVNQFRKAGIGNLVATILLAPLFVVVPPSMALGGFIIGLLAMPHAPPAAVMYVWDGIVVVFLFSWGIGLIAELQRAEALSLDKFLHLPVSLQGVFVINYLSSLFSLNLAAFVPGMLGLSLGMVFGVGLPMLAVVPLLLAFLLMVTAVTYHFQGWLAALMVNKRRRRTIIVFLTLGFVLLFQLPNLVNIMQPWKRQTLQTGDNAWLEEQKQINNAYAAGKITAPQLQERMAQAQRDHIARMREIDQAQMRQLEEVAWYINLAVPLGWLPLGAMEAAEHNVLPAALGTLAFALIGTASLWRSYITTIRIYTGRYTAGATAESAPVTPSRPFDNKRLGLLEKELPGVSEQAAAVALSCLRSLLRAPEAKMMLLSPIIMLIVFGSLFLASPDLHLPQQVYPLMAFGGMTMVLLGMIQLLANQFGFDRNGFRVYVLCGAPRRDILLGKNLAFAPLALSMASLVAVGMQVMHPMSIDLFLALFPQMLSIFLLFCLMANCLSILAPMQISAGSMRPANPKMLPMLLQMAFLGLLPVILAPVLLPLGLELLLDALEVVQGWPICLGLSLLECLLILFFYRLALTWQGWWLQAREQKILEIVTTKSE